MRRGFALVVLVVLVAACDNGGEETTTVATDSTTSTTEATEVCSDLTVEAVKMVEDLVRALDETTYEQLVDRALWSDGLISIEERGAALQAEVVAGGCEPGPIQQAVAGAAVNLQADSGIADLLLEAISP